MQFFLKTVLNKFTFKKICNFYRISTMLYTIFFCMYRKFYIFSFKYILWQWKSARNGEWIFHEKSWLKPWQGQTLSLELCQVGLNVFLEVLPFGDKLWRSIQTLFLKFSPMNTEKVLVIYAETGPKIFKYSKKLLNNHFCCHFFFSCRYILKV